MNSARIWASERSTEIARCSISPRGAFGWLLSSASCWHEEFWYFSTTFCASLSIIGNGWAQTTGALNKHSGAAANAIRAKRLNMGVFSFWQVLPLRFKGLLLWSLIALVYFDRLLN